MSMKAVILAGDLDDARIAATDFALLGTLAAALPDTPILDVQGQGREWTPRAVTVLCDAGHVVETCPRPAVRAAGSPHGLAAGTALAAYEHFKTRPAHTLHVARDIGAAHYILQARRLGLTDLLRRVVVHVTAPLLYRYEIGREQARSYADPARVFMERRVIELADRVIVNSQEVADWLGRRGWRDNCEIAPGPVALPAAPRSDPGTATDLRRLIFAGSLSDVKGLTSFVYAAEWLQAQGTRLDELVVSGDIVPDFPAEAFLEASADRLAAPIRRLAPDDRAGFLSLACAPGSLSVIASRFDDRPAALEELVALDAPVVAADTGDMRRVLEPRDAETILAEPHHLKLGAKILECAAAGLVTGYRGLRPRDLERNAKDWQKLVAATPEAPAAPAIASEKPLVSICMAHLNRPDSIALGLGSLDAQSYGNVETIIVDDGSTPDNLARLRALVAGRPITKVIEQENLYLGAARNTGARHAGGTYLLFKDDDNIAMPHEVETFVEIAERNGSDILTCFSDNFIGYGLPGPENINGIRRLPFGPDMHYGLFRNGLGDSNCFVRRSVWEALGGFTEHYKIGLDDHEFFLRALSKGYSVELVPEALYYYRLGGEKMKRFHVAALANEQRILQPLIDSGMLPAEMLPVVMLARQFN